MAARITKCLPSLMGTGPFEQQKIGVGSEIKVSLKGMGTAMFSHSWGGTKLVPVDFFNISVDDKVANVDFTTVNRPKGYWPMLFQGKLVWNNGNVLRFENSRDLFLADIELTERQILHIYLSDKGNKIKSADFSLVREVGEQDLSKKIAEMEDELKEKQALFDKFEKNPEYLQEWMNGKNENQIHEVRSGAFSISLDILESGINDMKKLTPGLTVLAFTKGYLPSI